MCIAQQSESRELKRLMIDLGSRMDDVRRGQRDSMLAKVMGAAASIAEANIFRESGGDPGTVWDKVSGVRETLLNAQELVLLRLDGLTGKLKGKARPADLKKSMKDIEEDVRLHLFALYRCFELMNEFGDIELDHVQATSPDYLEGHRQGIMESRAKRRHKVHDVTERLLTQIRDAAQTANENTLLHPKSAVSIVGSANSSFSSIDELHDLLGLGPSCEQLDTTPWLDALRDPGQRQTAMREARPVIGGAVGFGSLAVVAAKVVPKLHK
jgi:hypothetical protein